ncbi:MAG: hypothetical protein V4858_13450 [Pseudomonadota bacterium]
MHAQPPPTAPPRMLYRSRWNLATLAVGIALLIGGQVCRFAQTLVSKICR